MSKMSTYLKSTHENTHVRARAVGSRMDTGCKKGGGYLTGQEDLSLIKLHGISYRVARTHGAMM